MEDSQKKLAIKLGKSVALLAVLAACASPLRVSVKREWANTIRNFGLIPVYPMRENVYVGDMRVIGNVDDPFALGYRSFEHVDVSAIMRAEMLMLPELPMTTPTERTTGSGVFDFTQSSDGDVTAARTDTNRMHLAALPSISMARVSAADLAAKGPLGPASLIFDAGFRAEDSVSVTLDGIETLEISDRGAIQALHNWCGGTGDVSTDIALAASLAQVTAVKGQRDEGPDGNLNMITRIFYARSISYTTLRSRSFDVGGNAGGRGTNPTAVAPVSVQEDADGNPQSVPVVNLTTQLPNDLPGIAGTFVTSSSTSISLKQVFSRPMAFGVDVLSVRLVDLPNGGVSCGKFARPNPSSAFSEAVVAGEASDPDEE